MSRIGKLPVAIPDKVKVAVEGDTVRVEGPKGKLAKAFDIKAVEITLDDQAVSVSPRNQSRHARAMYGTARSIINGMVVGVTEGFQKSLTIQGVGFKAAVKGKALELAVGYSHEVVEPIPEGLTVTCPDPTKVLVSGADKQMVGEFAARVKRSRKMEPYKGKGVMIDGEHVVRKEGKKAG